MSRSKTCSHGYELGEWCRACFVADTDADLTDDGDETLDECDNCHRQVPESELELVRMGDEDYGVCSFCRP